MLIDDYRQRQPERPVERPPVEEGFSRQAYIVQVPEEGIPALEESPGTDVNDTVSSVDCLAYRIPLAGGELAGVPVTKQVFNLSTTEFAAGWALAVPDAFGAWVAVPLAAGEAGGSSLTVRDQDGSPQVFNVDLIEVSQTTGLYITDLGGGDVRINVFAGTASQNGYLAAGAQTTGGNKTFTTANYDIVVGDGINITDKAGASTSTASGFFKSETTILGASTLVELKDSTTGSLVSSVLTEGHGLVVLHGGLSAEYVTLTDSVGFGYRYLYSEPSTDDLIHEIRGTDFSSGARNSAYSVVIGSTRRKGGTATTGGLTFVGGLYISGTATGGSVAWGDITGTPTTLAGYGITDAASDAELASEVAALESYIDSEIAGLSSVYQPLDADLTSLAGATGTNTIYYRSAADTWSAVTVGSGLNFAGGTLTATGGTNATTVTVADTADSTCFVALFESATGDLAPKTDAGITYDASSGALTVNGLSAANVAASGQVSGATLASGGGLELGGATDATVTRSGAGDIAVEGNVLYRAGGTDVPVTDGGTGRSSHTAYAVLCGGTTTTAAQQSVASVGTSGHPLVSAGAGALPAFSALGSNAFTDGTIVAARLTFAATARFAGRITAGSGAGEELTGAQATSLLSDFVAAGGSAAKGLVPSPGATAYTNVPRLLGSQAAFVKPSGRVLGSPSYVAGSESTTSTTPVGLTTAQTITFTLDETCDVIISCEAACIMNTTSATGRLYINDGTTDHTVSVATVPVATGAVQLRGSLVQTSKAAGSYTYTLKFSVNSGQADFSARLMIANLTG